MVLYMPSCAAVKFYLKTKYFVTAQNLELIPKKGPGIVVANHRSVNDILLLAGYVPRTMHFVAKTELSEGEGLWKKIAAWYMKDIKSIPVNRNGKESSILKKCFLYLNAEELLAIFPEGTRNQDEYLRPFKPLVALLAQKKNAPIIPIGINGSEQQACRTDINMIVGEALWPQEDETRDELTHRTEQAVAELSGYRMPIYEQK